MKELLTRLVLDVGTKFNKASKDLCGQHVHHYSPEQSENCVVVFFFTILQTITALCPTGRQRQRFERGDLCVQDRGERSGGQGRRPSNPRQNNRGVCRLI